MGPVIPNTESKIIDIETGAELGANEKGENMVRGPNVMVGYLNNPKGTANAIDEEGWFGTGDVDFVDDEGDF